MGTITNYAKNVLEYFLQMPPQAGFATLQEEDLLVLKSPTKLPWDNFCWGKITSKNVEEVLAFFGDHSFTWAVQKSQKKDLSLLENAGLRFDSIDPEMSLDLSSYTPCIINTKIHIQEIDSPQLFDTWVAIGATVFKTSKNAFSQSFSSSFSQSNFHLFIGYYEKTPCAISLVCMGSTNIGIYAVGVLEEFRNRGLGKAMTQACLQARQASTRKRAVLQSSPMACPLYKSMGFKTISNTLSWVFEKN